MNENERFFNANLNKETANQPTPPTFTDENDDYENRPTPPTFTDENDDDENRPTPPTFTDENDDDENRPTPPTFTGDDSNTNDNSQLNPSSIINFVKSLFSNVTAQFNFMKIFNGFSPMNNFQAQPPMQGSFQQQFGMFQPREGFGLSPNFQPSQQNFAQQQNFTNSQFSFSTSSTKTMTLDSTGDKEVWLTEESEEVAINATNTTGSNILAGNNKDNQIFGGHGHNEMWGGATKTNDYLFGGEGENTFWYGKGEGIDLVENTKQGDTINLYNVTLGDISNIEITDSSISLVIGEGEGIGVNTTDAISPNFKLSDGESYNYNRNSGEWQKA